LQHSVVFRPVKKGAPSCVGTPSVGRASQTASQSQWRVCGKFGIRTFCGLPKINCFDQELIPGCGQMASKWLDFSTAKAFLVTFWAQKVTKHG
jgi:hypothetical protein